MVAASLLKLEVIPGVLTEIATDMQLTSLLWESHLNGGGAEKWTTLLPVKASS